VPRDSKSPMVRRRPGTSFRSCLREGKKRGQHTRVDNVARERVDKPQVERGAVPQMYTDKNRRALRDPNVIMRFSEPVVLAAIGVLRPSVRR